MGLKRIKKIVGLSWVMLLCFIILPTNTREVVYGAMLPEDAGIRLNQRFQLPSSSNSSVTTGDKYDVLEVTNSQASQKGMIWSTPNNMIDFRKDFSLSMYLYFGNTPADKAGDGMAFVLHRDPRGAHKNYTSTKNSQLGIYANPSSSETNLMSEALKNSYAIEFDSKYDRDTLDYTEYDILNGHHVASTFPGYNKVYTNRETDFFQPNRWSILHQTITYVNNLNNGSWRKFTVDWDVNARVLTYGLEGYGKKALSMPLNNYIFYPKDDPIVYWGFTGVTDGPNQNKRVIFDELPQRVTAKTTMKVVDASTNESVADASIYEGEHLRYEIDGEYLGGKEQWQDVDIKLPLAKGQTYLPETVKVFRMIGGKEEQLDATLVKMENNQVSFRVPEEMGSNDTQNDIHIRFETKVNEGVDTAITQSGVVFKGSNHIARKEKLRFSVKKPKLTGISLIPSETKPENKAVIDWTYRFSTEGEVRDVTFLKNLTSQLTYVSNSMTINEEKVDDHIWEGDIKRTFPTGTYQMNFQTIVEGNVGEEATVSLQVKQKEELLNHIMGKVTIANTAPEITSELSVATLSARSKFHFSGLWKDKESEKVTVLYQVNDGESVEINELSQEKEKMGDCHPFEMQLPTHNLSAGKHQIKLWVRDKEGATSQALLLELTVINELKLQEVSDIDFGEIQLGSKEKEYDPLNATTIKFIDSRKIGSSWKLQAKMTQEMKEQDGRHVLSGLHYQNDDQQIYFIVNQLIHIMTGKAKEIIEQEVCWEKNQGIRLRVYPGDYKGNYQGEITWMLANTPN